MKLHTIGELLQNHAFFKDLPAEEVHFISSCGQNKIFTRGMRMANEGESADVFYVLRSGKVSISTHLPHRGEVVLQTVGPGEILGWSWLFPPYNWTFDARALDEVHAIALNGKCLREKCESETGMGYRLMKKFAEIMSARLRATRLQLLDVYASPVRGGRIS